MNREVSAAGEADVTPAFWSPMDLCPKCLDHYMQTPLLVEACASVGIEHGKSTGLMLKEYFDGFHKGKHPSA